MTWATRSSRCTDCVVDDDPVGVLARDVGPVPYAASAGHGAPSVRSRTGARDRRGHDRSEADRIGAERGVGEEHLQGAQQAPSERRLTSSDRRSWPGRRARPRRWPRWRLGRSRWPVWGRHQHQGVVDAGSPKAASKMDHWTGSVSWNSSMRPRRIGCAGQRAPPGRPSFDGASQLGQHVVETERAGSGAAIAAWRASAHQRAQHLRSSGAPLPPRGRGRGPGSTSPSTWPSQVRVGRQGANELWLGRCPGEDVGAGRGDLALAASTRVASGSVALLRQRAEHLGGETVDGGDGRRVELGDARANRSARSPRSLDARWRGRVSERRYLPSRSTPAASVRRERTRSRSSAAAARVKVTMSSSLARIRARPRTACQRRQRVGLAVPHWLRWPSCLPAAAPPDRTARASWRASDGGSSWVVCSIVA